MFYKICSLKLNADFYWHNLKNFFIDTGRILIILQKLENEIKCNKEKIAEYKKKIDDIT